MACSVATSATDHATTARPTRDATPRVSRRPEARSAPHPTRSSAISTRPAAPARSHTTGERVTPAGMRSATVTPRTLPTSTPMPTTVRNWRSAVARTTTPRSTGASSTCCTSAASNTSGPPCEPERRPIAAATAATIPTTAGPCSAPRVDGRQGRPCVGDRGGEAEQHGDACRCRRGRRGRARRSSRRGAAARRAVPRAAVGAPAGRRRGRSHGRRPDAGIVADATDRRSRRARSAGAAGSHTAPRSQPAARWPWAAATPPARCAAVSAATAASRPSWDHIANPGRRLDARRQQRTPGVEARRSGFRRRHRPAVEDAEAAGRVHLDRLRPVAAGTTPTSRSRPASTAAASAPRPASATGPRCRRPSRARSRRSVRCGTSAPARWPGRRGGTPGSGRPGRRSRSPTRPPRSVRGRASASGVRTRASTHTRRGTALDERHDVQRTSHRGRCRRTGDR